MDAVNNRRFAWRNDLPVLGVDAAGSGVMRDRTHNKCPSCGYQHAAGIKRSSCWDCGGSMEHPDPRTARIAALEARCDEYERIATDAAAELARLKAEVKAAEQRGYAKAMEAERLLYDHSLKIAMKDIRNDALEEAAHLIECDAHAMAVQEAAAAIRALKRAK